MKKKVKYFLKSKTFIIGVPTIVRFRIKGNLNRYENWKATKGTEVVKLSDVKKAFKLDEQSSGDKK